MSNNPWVFLIRCAEDLVHTNLDLVRVTRFPFDKVADVQLVLDEMLMNGMDRIQWGFLPRDPHIVTSRFLSF